MVKMHSSIIIMSPDSSAISRLFSVFLVTPTLIHDLDLKKPAEDDIMKQYSIDFSNSVIKSVPSNFKFVQPQALTSDSDEYFLLNSFAESAGGRRAFRSLQSCLNIYALDSSNIKIYTTAYRDYLKDFCGYINVFHPNESCSLLKTLISFNNDPGSINAWTIINCLILAYPLGDYTTNQEGALQLRILMNTMKAGNFWIPHKMWMIYDLNPLNYVRDIVYSDPINVLIRGFQTTVAQQAYSSAVYLWKQRNRTWLEIFLASQPQKPALLWLVDQALRMCGYKL